MYGITVLIRKHNGQARSARNAERFKIIDITHQNRTAIESGLFQNFQAGLITIHSAQAHNVNTMLIVQGLSNIIRPAQLIEGSALFQIRQHIVDIGLVILTVLQQDRRILPGCQIGRRHGIGKLFTSGIDNGIKLLNAQLRLPGIRHLPGHFTGRCIAHVGHRTVKPRQRQRRCTNRQRRKHQHQGQQKGP